MKRILILIIMCFSLGVFSQGINPAEIMDAPSDRYILLSTLPNGTFAMSDFDTLTTDLVNIDSIYIKQDSIICYLKNSVEYCDTFSTTNQTLTSGNDTIYLSQGGYVLTDPDTTNEIQTLSILSHNLSISDGNTITLPEPDGSETILNSGLNIIISGSGTVAAPYIINSIEGGDLFIDTIYLTQDSIITWEKGLNTYYDTIRLGTAAAQTLSIDSLNRVFTVSISGGNSVKFEDTGGSGATELSDLTDVNTSTPTNKNFLIADGVDWESRAIAYADIPDPPTILSYDNTYDVYYPASAASHLLLGTTTLAITTYPLNVYGDGWVKDNFYVDGIADFENTRLSGTLTLNATATDVLVRNTSTGNVEYRTAASISGGTVTAGQARRDATQTITTTTFTTMDIATCEIATGDVTCSTSTERLTVGADGYYYFSFNGDGTVDYDGVYPTVEIMTFVNGVEQKGVTTVFDDASEVQVFSYTVILDLNDTDYIDVRVARTGTSENPIIEHFQMNIHKL